MTSPPLVFYPNIHPILVSAGNEMESCYDILTKYPIDLSAWDNEPTPEVPER